MKHKNKQMGFDYYTKSELVFEYIDDTGKMQKITTNSIIEGHHFYAEPECHLDDTMSSYAVKYQIAIDKHLDKLTYTKEEHRLSYEPCPGIHKLLRVYQEYSAWER